MEENNQQEEQEKLTVELRLSSRPGLKYVFTNVPLEWLTSPDCEDCVGPLVFDENYAPFMRVKTYSIIVGKEEVDDRHPQLDKQPVVWPATNRLLN